MSGRSRSGFVPRRFVIGQFATADALLAGTRKVREAGHKGSTRTRLIRARARGGARPRPPEDPDPRAVRRDRGRVHRLRDDLLHERHRLPDQRRRPAAAQPADQPSDHLRARRAAGRHLLILRLLRARGAAQAVPPRLRVGVLRARADRRVLPVGRGAPAGEAEKVAPRCRARARVGRASRSRSDDARTPVRSSSPSPRRCRSCWPRRWLRREHPRPDGRSPARRSATRRASSSTMACRCARPRGDGAARAHRHEHRPHDGPRGGPADRRQRRALPSYVAIPLPVRPRQLLDLGRKRFDITCATCHGPVGDGNSIVATQMSLRPPPSLHKYATSPPATSSKWSPRASG